MPSRNHCRGRRTVLTFLVALLVGLASVPAHALPVEQAAPSRTFLQLVESFRGWLVSLWAGEGMSIDPHGNPTGGPPSGNATTNGDEGATVDPHGD